IIFFVLQQIEGNLIYPYVVGNSVGLPSIWVLVAVTLGGSMMGIVGMLIFITLCSVLYALLRDEVNGRLERPKPTGRSRTNGNKAVRTRRPKDKAVKTGPAAQASAMEAEARQEDRSGK
uniref:AI-2E family transporter n=1 Tax=Eisenbergiella sp. TaxID=1924109 RepID=UPI003AB25BCE